jgi:hypothetical protein
MLIFGTLPKILPPACHDGDIEVSDTEVTEPAPDPNLPHHDFAVVASHHGPAGRQSE